MFFSKKKCRYCGEEVKGGWKFCPHCGEQVVKKYKNIFDEINKNFEDAERTTEFRPMKRINIVISGGAGMKPRIEVKSPSHRGVEVRRVEKTRDKLVRTAKTTEEPETSIERAGNRQIVSIKLPGVKMEDIEIKRMEQSIEVKAFAGNKAYFKLIPIPYNASINKRFENDMLKIEVQR